MHGWSPTKFVAAVSAASMAGVPLLLGFVAKEAAYAAFADGPFSASGVVLAGIVIGSTLTVAYSLRFLHALVRRESRPKRVRRRGRSVRSSSRRPFSVRSRSSPVSRRDCSIGS